MQRNINTTLLQNVNIVFAAYYIMCLIFLQNIKTKINIMKKPSQKELELRKWALEMSFEHGKKLFHKEAYTNFTPNQYVKNAKSIIDLVKNDWENDNPLPNPPEIQSGSIVEIF